MTDQNKAAPAPSSLAGGATGRLSALLSSDHLRGDYPLAGLGAVSWNDLRAILAALSSEAPAREGAESGWLIEGYDSKRGAFKAQWWSLHPDMGEDCQGWTTDSLKALRFSREADAQAYIDSIGWTETRATEHRWSDPVTAASGDEDWKMRPICLDTFDGAVFPGAGNNLTPRHEAPARNPLDPDAPSEAMIDAGLKVDWSNEDERGTVINVWYAMNAARRHEAPAAFHDRFGAPAGPVPPKRPEAPAEGAGEDVNWKAEYEAVCEARIADRQKSQEIINERDKWIVELIRESDALRARSSAPEAREGALGNLLAVIHGDGGHRALEVGTKQAALEAEKIVARLLSSAPEARDGEAVAWIERVDLAELEAAFNHSSALVRQVPLYCSEGVDAVPLYTHPAAPSADKLRIAVEALEPFALIGSHYRTGGLRQDIENRAPGFMRMLDFRAFRRADQALAALEAEGA